MRAEVASLSVLLLVSVPWVAGSFSPFTESVSLVERTLDGASCSLPTSFQVNSASAGVARGNQALSSILSGACRDRSSRCRTRTACCLANPHGGLCFCSMNAELVMRTGESSRHDVFRRSSSSCVCSVLNAAAFLVLLLWNVLHCEPQSLYCSFSDFPHTPLLWSSL